MGKLRYLVFSDLHLGARSSLLTHIDNNGKAKYQTQSATLKKLAYALRKTTAALSDEKGPTLILLGDVVDLGLSKTGSVAAAFLPFIDALFPKSQEPQFFDKDIIYVPGNHDHHLWRVAQDEYYVKKLPEFVENSNGFIPSPIEHTQLFGGKVEDGTTDRLPCSLLTQLMRTRPHLKEHTVSIAYPNLGLLNAKGKKRGVVLHHGHYIDSMYRAMSRFNQWLAGTDIAPATIAQIERENGPWVDFLWSNLGSAGEVASDINSLYATMLNARSSHKLATTISGRVLTQLNDTVGIQADSKLPFDLTFGGVIRGMVDLTAGRAAESQRDGYREVFSNSEIDDLRWYIGTPLAKQMEQQRMASFEDLSFIFGHTHKPFQDQLSIEPFKQTVAIYNTGGWVMDRPAMMPCQGGAAILIDDDMNVASLRLFNDPVNDVIHPVRAAGIGGIRDSQNPLLEALQKTLDQQSDAWQEFTSAIHKAIKLQAGITYARSHME